MISGSGNYTCSISGPIKVSDITVEGFPKAINLNAYQPLTFDTASISGEAGNLLSLNAGGSSAAYLKPTSGYFSADYIYTGELNVIGTGFLGTHSINFNTSSGPLTINANVVFATPSAQVSGQVTLNSTGVSGAIVRLVRQSDNMEIGTTTTDGSGNYSFYADTASKYHVFVEYTSGGTKYNAKSLWELTPA